MTDATINALILAIPPTLMALAAFLQSLKNTSKANSLEKKTDEIHTLANSNLAKVSTELQVANAKISGMEKLLAALTEQKNAANVAAALATLPAVPGPPGPPGEPGPQGVQGETGPKGSIFK